MIQNHNHKVLAINGVSDHVHILIGMRPTQGLSELVQKIKGGSSHWINEQKFLKSKFAWQEGYGAFSYTKSDVQKVINYILNQEEHHKKRTFEDEYQDFLNKFEVDEIDKYLFKTLE